ncbi:hypothetical protein C8Z97_005171 [Escherichia coli]|nr:hypothetical protein [Escherichia coli]EEZ7565819.1 hypothetical protein [Escherichia coli]EFL4224072.1 hypothetical protein [Escherichia coli]EFL4227098.1 hypothetical protein [Escherichia coli]EIJ7875723.1 hypothetical protein [Escherichia coli]
MNAKIQTIPELLICTRGNQTEVARILNCNRATVRKYIDDKDAKSLRNSILLYEFASLPQWLAFFMSVTSCVSINVVVYVRQVVA